jgi:hypothetical protein
MLTKSDVIDCFSIAVAVFPQYPITEAQVVAYAHLLSDLDVGKRELSIAIAEVCKDSRFFPTIAEIREELRAQMRSSVPARQQYDEFEFEKKDAIPMPERVREILAPIFRQSQGLARLDGSRMVEMVNPHAQQNGELAENVSERGKDE